MGSLVYIMKPSLPCPKQLFQRLSYGDSNFLFQGEWCNLGSFYLLKIYFPAWLELSEGWATVSFNSYPSDYTISLNYFTAITGKVLKAL